MHSCSIIMATGSHGSTYYGGVRLGPISDRSFSNAMQAQEQGERSVGRDLSTANELGVSKAEQRGISGRTSTRIVAACACTQPRKFPSRQSTVHTYPLTASSFASRARSHAQ